MEILSNQRIIGKYTIIKTTGEGTYAKTKIAINNEDNKYYALKILKKDNGKFNEDIVKNEIDILKRLDHPNIIKIIEYIEDIAYYKKNGQLVKASIIVMEFAQNGELYHYLNNPAISLSEEIVRKLFKQLIEAVEYCHNKGVTHRDLKPENILFDCDFNIKVIDFGFAALFSNHDSNSKFKAYIGTERYMAPEIFKRSYTGPEVDLFACAIILFYMIIKKPPFMFAQPTDYYYKEFYNKLPRTHVDNFWIKHAHNLSNNDNTVSLSVLINQDFQNLINNMLKPDPKERLSIAEIKDSIWYKGPICDPEIMKRYMSDMKIIIEKQIIKERASQKKIKALSQLYLNKKQNFTGKNREVCKELHLSNSINTIKTLTFIIKEEQQPEAIEENISEKYRVPDTIVIQNKQESYSIIYYD